MAEGGVNWQALFPTRWSFLIFVTYMMCFIFQGIMVTASQQPDYSYGYNTVTVVLFTEATKLLASFILYLKDHNIATFASEIKKHFRVLLLYMIPALLYCFYNNLAFVNLAAFDPTTYFLLLQFRVVVTGVVFQIVFKKKLSTKQWVSLVILTIGCITKQLSTAEKSSSTQATPSIWDNLLTLHIGLLLVQVLCSCLAGVYNEKLLKDTGAEVHIMMQNIFMYIDSILCNLAVLVYRGELSFAFTYTSLIQIVQPIVVMIILNNAAVGIVTSFFLRSLNSILKTFASALELVFTAVLSWMIFGIPINGWTFLAIALVSLASWMYSQNPVVNRGRLDEVEKARDSEVEEKLLPRNAPTLV